MYLRPDLIELFKNSDIICLQETWYFKQNLQALNNLHEDFYGFGKATVNYEDGIHTGRPYGGTAIFWRKSLHGVVKIIDFGLDWCSGLSFYLGNRHFAILNVYMPYQADHKYDEYVDKLGALGAALDELEVTCFGIVGDWNVNLSNLQNSLFGDLITNFVLDYKLKIPSESLLPKNSYTYVSPAWDTTSWLDFTICSSDFTNIIVDMSIAYDLTDEDHIPVYMSLNTGLIPSLTSVSNSSSYNPKISWENLKDSDLQSYCQFTHEELSKVYLPHSALNCKDLSCKDDNHRAQIEQYYKNIMNALTASSNKLLKHDQVNFHSKPGWTEFVSDIYKESREVRRKWLISGKPRSGPLLDLHLRTKARFKYTLRFIKRHEESLRKESLANKLCDFSHEQFWKEIKVLNNSRTPLPTTVDGVSSPEGIANMWKSHFQDLFNCIQSNVMNSRDLDCSGNTISEVVVSSTEIEQVILSLPKKKSCGLDGIQAEHLQYSSNVLNAMLSQCISSLLIHGFLPDNLMNVILVPILKDKAGEISSKNNYRPIAIASVCSKIIEKIILQRIENHIETNPNQFGFKPKHGTDQCIYILKEIIDYYRTLNTTVFVAFLDASKAFDRINHERLFAKLIKRNVPLYLIRILMFWYHSQTFCVRWGDTYSDFFGVSNGVRQGGILSPFLFNVYFDDLSNMLNKLYCGCVFNNNIVNHLMYADDLVLFAPSVCGLQTLVSTCEVYAEKHDVSYNSMKSSCMIFRPKGDKYAICDKVYLNNGTIKNVESTKYLGHYISNDLNDNLDIKRQCRQIYAQGNSLIRKFYMCSVEVKLKLFESYCSPMYTPHLWCKYSKTCINKLYVAYHCILKILLGFSKFDSNGLVCTVFNTRSCTAVIRNYVYKFMRRVDLSTNVIIRDILSSSLLFKSNLRKHWNQLLYSST